MKLSPFKMVVAAAALILTLTSVSAREKQAERMRLRDYGLHPGIFETGQWNAITDVPGVKVGQVTLIEGDDMRTGVTAIIPHEGNLFNKKCPAAVFVGNGFGKLAGTTQIMELGNIETPIILTNTLNVAEGIRGVVTYSLENNPSIHSVNAVVGETNDGSLNNIRARYVTEAHVLEAIASAQSGPVEEGVVGAGTGTVCFGFKGGIGTSSRVTPTQYGRYTVGVLVQSNYGGVLEIDGMPIGELLDHYSFQKGVEEDKKLMNPDGSCMIVVITDAPVDARNLERMAKRAFMGLAKTGGIASNGSGDYIIAVSTYRDNLIDSKTDYYFPTLLHNDDMSALFNATIEATEEALWNSLFKAHDVTGCGNTVKALPLDKVVPILQKKYEIKAN